MGIYFRVLDVKTQIKLPVNSEDQAVQKSAVIHYQDVKVSFNHVVAETYIYMQW